jgi:hypothetical protein
MKKMNCLSSLSLFTVVLGLLILTLTGTAMSQNCAPVFGGTDQDKLIEDIATCAKEVSDTLNARFDAYLIPETCHIHISVLELQTYGMVQHQFPLLAKSQHGKERAEDINAKAPQQFFECMKQYGWEIPYNSVEFAQ